MKTLIPILIIFLPSIIKSVREKKTIQEKRKYTPYNRPDKSVDSVEEKANKRKYTRNNRPVRPKSVDTIRAEEIEKIDRKKVRRKYEELESKVGELSREKEVLKRKLKYKNSKEVSHNFNKITKEDILKGVILKEILSEPKCMQNRIR